MLHVRSRLIISGIQGIYKQSVGFSNLKELIQFCQSYRIGEYDPVACKKNKCNCEEWKKRYKCNHSIAVAYHKKPLDWPTLDLNIDGNRPRGGPKHNPLALSQATAAALNEQLFPDCNENTRESRKRKKLEYCTKRT